MEFFRFFAKFDLFGGSVILFDLLLIPVPLCFKFFVFFNRASGDHVDGDGNSRTDS
jgi:hypothetical protein